MSTCPPPAGTTRTAQPSTAQAVPAAQRRDRRVPNATRSASPVATGVTPNVTAVATAAPVAPTDIREAARKVAVAADAARSVGGEDDGGEHQPTDEDPGAAQGRRVDDGTRHDLGGPDGRPEDARRQDEQDAGSLVSLLHPVEGSRIDGWITGKPNIVRSGRARWPDARFGAVPGRIGRTTFGDHPTRQPSRRGACRTPRK